LRICHAAQSLSKMPKQRKQFFACSHHNTRV
jgi:hypothetical protein